MKYTIILSCFAALLCAVAPGCGEVVSGDRSDAGADASDFDPCLTEVCECETAGDCGDHEFCDTSGPGRLCACVAGYERDGSDSCVWGVVPQDPSFEDATRWTERGGAGVSPLSSGDIAPGEAFLNAEAVCAMGGVSQEVIMPDYDAAEPLVAMLNYQSQGSGFPGEGVGVGLGLGGTWKTFFEAQSWRTERVCLGASSYGGPVTIEVSADREPFDCGGGGTATLAIDHVQIVPADPDECPVLGTVRNADFEDMGGWEGYSTNNANATIAPGAGDSGSNAYHLSTTRICNTASVTGKSSLPDQALVPSPAIEFWWSASNGKTLNVSLDNDVIAQLTGTGPSPSTGRVCIPPNLQGSVASLQFALPYSYGTCATLDVRDAFIDNITFVSDPVCGTDPYVIDGGFESGLSPAVESPWSFSFEAGRGTAALINNAGQAHSGNGALQLMNRQECSSASASGTVVVPPSDGANGPAFKFWYNAAPAPVTSFRTSPGNGDLEEAGEWRQETVCLNPNLAGRPQQVTFYQTTNGGTCANTFPAEYAYVDDMEVTTDPGCPAQ